MIGAGGGFLPNMNINTEIAIITVHARNQKTIQIGVKTLAGIRTNIGINAAMNVLTTAMDHFSLTQQTLKVIKIIRIIMIQVMGHFGLSFLMPGIGGKM
jgi:hypothetical protein